MCSTVQKGKKKPDDETSDPVANSSREVMLLLLFFDRNPNKGGDDVAEKSQFLPFHNAGVVVASGGVG